MFTAREKIVLLALCATLSVKVLFAEDDGPRTQPVTGTFRASPAKVKQRTCQGQDGAYIEIRGKFSGSITSSDPRVTGRLEFTADPGLLNLNTGLGTFQGTFEIIDPATNRKKAEGLFSSVITDGGLNHGYATGVIFNRGPGANDRLFANYNSILDVALNVTGHIGDTGDPRQPAVIQSGFCSGPFTERS